MELTWVQKKFSPTGMSSRYGAAVVLDDIAYFSDGNYMYSYDIADDTWTKLIRCESSNFGMAVVNSKVTTVGGLSSGTVLDTLLSLTKLYFNKGMRWDKNLPPMNTPRARPAVVTTPTHLVVAGGQGKSWFGLDTIEALHLDTLCWSFVGSLPSPLLKPSLILCGASLYFGGSDHESIFSCLVEDLIDSSRDTNWTELNDVRQINAATLAAFEGRLVAFGGVRNHGLNYTTVVKQVHCYDRSTNSWSVIGEMLTSRSDPLVAVLPSNELIVVGGHETNHASTSTNVTEVARYERCRKVPPTPVPVAPPPPPPPRF